MTQIQIDNLKTVLSFLNVPKKTWIKFIPANNREIEFNIATNKKVKIYKSNKYRGKVLAIQYNNTKYLILTKQMWTELKKYFSLIENEFN